jgi:dolichyl-phosphate-mannose-protein mannosyltransferase
MMRAMPSTQGSPSSETDPTHTAHTADPTKPVPEATADPAVDRAPDDGFRAARFCPARFRYATAALAVGLLALGVFWRLLDLGYPASFAFDEHHFVRNARNYITHQADWNDHPPLGKLLLVPAMQLFGDNGVGWRLSSALLGLVLIALAGLIAGKIFADRRVGLLTAAFVAIDGFYISYARIALLDTPMTVFIYAALALMLWGRSLPWFAAAAVCVGLAVATKWTGVCIILIAPWLLMRRRRSPAHVIWMFGLAGSVYVGVVALALRITHQPISIAGLIGTNVSLLKHHAAFTTWDNAASSKWYSWPFLTHPIVMHYDAVDSTMVRATTSLGNVLLWFATTAVIGWTLFATAQTLWRARRSRDVLATIDKGGLFVVATMVALILPFVLTHRQSYIFHYLGSYGLGLGLLAAWVVKLEKRFARSTLAFVALATAVSIVYAPVWTNALISRTGFIVRLPFPGWR